MKESNMRVKVSNLIICTLSIYIFHLENELQMAENRIDELHKKLKAKKK